MPNQNYRRGRQLEWQVRKDLENMGYHAMRTAGSHGEFDIIAYITPGNHTIITFIQCKLTKDAKQIPSIIKKATEKVTLPYINSPLVTVRTEIAIKVHGSKGYEFYPIGA